MASLVGYPRAAAICVGTLIATVAFYFGTSLQPVWPLVWLAPAAVLFMALRLSAIATACVGFAAYALGSLNMWSYEANVLEFPRITVFSGLVVPAIMFTLSVIFFRALVRSGAPWLATLAFPAAFVSFEFIRS